MKKKQKVNILLYLLIVFFPLTNPTFANVDSLKTLLKKNPVDSIKIELLSILVEEVEEVELPFYNDQMKALLNDQIKQRSGNPSWIAFYSDLLAATYMNNAFINNGKGLIHLTPGDYLKALTIYLRNDNKKSAVVAYRQLAGSYRAMGDAHNSLKYEHEALKLNESMRDSSGIAYSLNGMASTYQIMGDYESAIHYYTRALEIQKRMKNEAGMASTIGNLGVTFHHLKKFDAAIDCYRQTLSLSLKIGKTRTLPVNYMNVGTIHEKRNQNDSAIFYYNKALQLSYKFQDSSYIIQIYTNFAKVYANKKDKIKSLEYCNKAQGMAIRKRQALSIAYSAEIASIIHKRFGQYKESLEAYELYIRTNDSILSESNRKASIKSQLKYEYEKQAAADSVAHAKESEIKNVELAKQKAEISAKKNQQYALFGGLGLVMIFAGFMYNRFKVTQKQKGIIEQQKEVVEEQKKLVEEKQKEILDSIHYARRIQMAQIPSEKRIFSMINNLKNEH